MLETGIQGFKREFSSSCKATGGVGSPPLYSQLYNPVASGCRRDATKPEPKAHAGASIGTRLQNARETNER
jgi:hypothetical protein